MEMVKDSLDKQKKSKMKMNKFMEVNQ